MRVITEEPAYGSVVLDYMGDAWQQRLGSQWYCAIDDNDFSRWEWSKLTEELGPITLIFDAEEAVL